LIHLFISKHYNLNPNARNKNKKNIKLQTVSQTRVWLKIVAAADFSSSSSAAVAAAASQKLVLVCTKTPD
jgi:hypothetical protein